MPSFEFEKKISLGNLMSAMIILVSVIGAYFTLDSRTGVNAEDIDQESKTRMAEIAALNQRMANFEGKFEALVDSINRDRLGQTQQMTQLSSDVSYVKSTLEDMRRTFNQPNGTAR